MKIAFICTEKLPVPPISGGAIQLYISEIIPYLSQDYEITVFSITHPTLPNEEIQENVRYIRLPAQNTAEYLTKLEERVSDEFDLVHIFNRPLWVLALNNKIPNTKMSLSIHNEMFLPEKISAEKAVQCIERVEFINTVSQFIADGIKQLYPIAESKLNVIYSGVNVKKYKPNWTLAGLINKNKLKRKFGLENYKVILYVGRLSIKKGTHILMKAMADVMKQNSNVALVIVGSKWYGGNKQDDYTKSLTQLAEKINGRIVFTGFVTPDEIPSYYNLGDIFVCPSQWNEPLARVHYEAMAAGMPIITTNRGGNAEVVSGFGNGFVLDDYLNRNAFVKHINFLINNPFKALIMGVRARLIAIKNYKWERVARDVKKAIDFSLNRGE